MVAAVAEDLFVASPGGARLIAGRRRSDGEVRFPLPSGTDAALYDRFELSEEGRLWTFTVQRFRPKTPPYIGADEDASFTPFAVGYVEFEGQIIVEGRILGRDYSNLRVGQRMRVTTAPFATSTRGEVLTYAFEPVEQI